MLLLLCLELIGNIIIDHIIVIIALAIMTHLSNRLPS